MAENLAIVQTLDFFGPLTNDPYVFGQIAAANSLSDVYAMGGRPVTALNIVGFPDDKLPLEMLNEILRGGADKTTEAGASILGGHTVRDVEVKYGLSVTGLVDPAQLVTNAGAQVGDVLVLTKPIGTGATTAAYQKNAITDDEWAQSCAHMTRLNAAAATAMVAAEAHAATDITGFGLLGHASELTEASGVTVEIEAHKVPLQDGVLALSKTGFVTRAVSPNLAYLETRLEIRDKPEEALFNLLIDAQTSGGLLIALAPSALDAFARAFNGVDARDTWTEIGRVTEESKGLVRLV